MERMEMVKDKTERKVKMGRPPKITDVTRDLIIRLYNEDKPCDYIADACNISVSSVFRVLREERKRRKV